MAIPNATESMRHDKVPMRTVFDRAHLAEAFSITLPTDASPDIELPAPAVAGDHSPWLRTFQKFYGCGIHRAFAMQR
jgi:hypothetical protein